MFVCVCVMSNDVCVAVLENGKQLLRYNDDDCPSAHHLSISYATINALNIARIMMMMMTIE